MILFNNIVMLAGMPNLYLFEDVETAVHTPLLWVDDTVHGLLIKKILLPNLKLPKGDNWVRIDSKKHSIFVEPAAEYEIAKATNALTQHMLGGMAQPRVLLTESEGTLVGLSLPRSANQFMLPFIEYLAEPTTKYIYDRLAVYLNGGVFTTTDRQGEVAVTHSKSKVIVTLNDTVYAILHEGIYLWRRIGPIET